MERLLEIAGKAADQAEIYFLEHQSDQIQFENGRLKEIESKMQSGLSLRIIKDGMPGFCLYQKPFKPGRPFASGPGIPQREGGSPF